MPISFLDKVEIFCSRLHEITWSHRSIIRGIFGYVLLFNSGHYLGIVLIMQGVKVPMLWHDLLDVTPIKCSEVGTCIASVWKLSYLQNSLYSSSIFLSSFMIRHRIWWVSSSVVGTIMTIADEHGWHVDNIVLLITKLSTGCWSLSYGQELEWTLWHLHQNPNCCQWSYAWRSSSHRTPTGAV